MTAHSPAVGSGPVLFAYDGSELAKLAIADAGTLLAPGQQALVVTAWRTSDVDFEPAGGFDFDAQQASAVRAAAEQTAAAGAELAAAAGFQAESMAIESAPAWKSIVELADERDARLIVLGSHGRRKALEVFLGSVAGSVAAHSMRAVLITHRKAAGQHA